MESNNNSQKVSFWEFLSQHPIYIPIIQRDYAQGRKGKGNLRHNFLTSLHNALTGGNELKLDFVYGSIENGCFYPLDGQQRLTTLWLLHLYVAFRAGVTMVEEQERYRKAFLSFSYQTRSSSIEFCRQLVNYLFSEKARQDFKPGESIVSQIKRQTWYYTRYRQDPTITAMLRMLQGDETEQNNSAANGIEQIFTEGFPDMWSLLEDAENCPIKFYYRGMMDENMPLSDDLYIKMNARGKQLTHFENFKSQFLSYDDNKYFVLTDPSRIDKDFVNHLENSWTQIFWKYRHKDKAKIDEIYFKFLNNFFLGYYICRQRDKALSDEELGKSLLFERLYGRYADRTFIPPTNEFISISDYAPILTEDMKKVLYNTMNGLEYLHNMSKDGVCQLFEAEPLSLYVSDKQNPFAVIPEYDAEQNAADANNLPVSNLTQTQRIIFYAFCRYCEALSNSNSEAYSIEHLQDWIRVAYCVSYHTVNSQETMMSVLHLVEEMAPHCLNIKEYLCTAPAFQSKAAKEQVEEEIQKAMLERSKNNGEWYRERIIKAELHPLFNGCIRFLLWDSDGNYNTSASLFEMKLNFALSHFDQYGAVRKYAAEMLRTVMSKYDFWALHYHHRIFHNDRKTWFEQILTNYYFRLGIHHLLTFGSSSNLQVIDRHNHQKDLMVDIIGDKGFLKFILKKDMDMYIRAVDEGTFSIYRCNTSEGIQLQRYQRDAILTSLMYCVPCRVRGLHPVRSFHPHFFWGGFSLSFEYLSKKDGKWHKIEWHRSGAYEPSDVNAFENDLNDIIHNGVTINGLRVNND